MITSRERSSYFEKIFLTKSGACRSSNWVNFRHIFLGGDTLISEYFESKFLLCFIDLSNVHVRLKKSSHFYQKAFIKVKKVKCILNYKKIPECYKVV